MESEKSNVKKGFGAAVRAWRLKLGISQEELASRAGLHRTYICDVERGARNVTLQSMEKLARALQVPMSSLVNPDLSRLAGNTTALPLPPPLKKPPMAE